MSRLTSIILLLSSLGLQCQDQPQSALAGAEAKDPAVECQRKADRLREMAAALPLEFGADILLTLLENGVLKPTKHQQEALEVAHSLSRQAQERYPGRVLGVRAESLEGVLVRGYGRRVDQQSLGLRVLKQAARIQPAALRRYFEPLPLIPIGPSNCGDIFAYEPQAYLSAIRLVFETGFSAEERRLRQDVAFLSGLFTSLQSPLEIAPALRLVTTLPLSLESRERLLAALSDRMRSFPADERGMQIMWRSMRDGIFDLLSRSELRPASERFLQSFLQWAKTTVASPKCAPLPIGSRIIDQAEEYYKLNDELQVLIPNLPGLREKSAERPRTRGREEVVRTAPLFQSGEGEMLYRTFRDLYITPALEKTQDPWQEAVAAFLGKIKVWPEPHDSTTFYFLEKTTLLSQFLTMPAAMRTTSELIDELTGKRPPQPAPIRMRDQAIQMFVDVLDSAAGNQVFQERRLLWFSELIDLSASLERLPPEYLTPFIAALSRSRSPVAGAYGAIMDLKRLPGCVVVQKTELPVPGKVPIGKVPK